MGNLHHHPSGYKHPSGPEVSDDDFWEDPVEADTETPSAGAEGWTTEEPNQLGPVIPTIEGSLKAARDAAVREPPISPLGDRIATSFKAARDAAAQAGPLRAETETGPSATGNTTGWRLPNDQLRYGPTETTYIWHTDTGTGLIPKGTINSIYGETGKGKTWAALVAVFETLKNDESRVIWWNHDSTDMELNKRLEVMSLWEHITNDNYGYSKGHLGIPQILEAADWLADGVLVIDTMEAAGCPRDGTDINDWWTKNVIPFTNRGATIILVDHITKKLK